VGRRETLFEIGRIELEMWKRAARPILKYGIASPAIDLT